MSTFAGPEINNDNLVLHYDMSNTQRSFAGMPVVNRYLIPTPDRFGFVTFANNGTNGFKRIYSGTYDNYTIKSSDVVYYYESTFGGCHYHGNSFTVSTGQVYTFSFDYYVSPDSTNYPSTNYIANMEVYETSTGSYVYQTGAFVADPTPTIKGVWKRGSMTVTMPTLTAGNAGFSLYPGACSNSRLADSGYILYKNPQVELNSFATPFVAGTRTSSQSVLDLTGTNTLSVNALTYASDNTFGFSAPSNSYISAAANPAVQFLGTAAYTLEAWVYPTVNPGANNWTGIFNREWDNGTGRDGYNMYLLGSAGTTVQFTTERFTTGTSTNAYVGLDQSVAVNTWSHLVAVYNGSTLSLYRNGALVMSNPSTGNLTNTTTTLTIGRRDVNYFTGKIAVAKIYNTALSTADIAQNFNALRGRFGI